MTTPPPYPRYCTRCDAAPCRFVDNRIHAPLNAPSEDPVHLHPPSDAATELAWCYIHHCPEPDRPGDHRACLECGHVYRTPRDLQDAVQQMLVDLYVEDPDDDIERLAVLDHGEVKISLNGQGHLPVGCCPLCMHDF